MSNHTELKIDAHAYDRMGSRISTTEQRTLEAHARRAWFNTQRTGASTVAVISQKVARRTLACGSTGDLICCVIRNGVMTTAFMRGSNQDLRPAFFRTDRVVREVKIRGRKGQRRGRF